MHHRLFGKALRIRNKIFKQNLAENYSKSTKIAITARTFSKFSGGAYPLKLFLLLNQLQICSAEKKIRLKKFGNYAPPLSRLLATPLDPSMSLPTNINERNAAINHGRIVSTKSRNGYSRSAKTNRPFIVDWYKDHSSYSRLEYPDVLEAVFCFYCRVFNATVSRLIWG